MQPRGLLALSLRAPTCLHVKFTSLSPPQGPDAEARPREGQKLQKRKRAREGKRFQDISSLWLEGVLEMWRWGWVGCRGRVRLSGRSSFQLNLVTASSEATGDLVSYSAKSEEKRHRTTSSYLGRATIIQLKLWHRGEDNWCLILEKHPIRLITAHRLVKRLLNCNLPEIIIIPSVIEHKRESLGSISICAGLIMVH